MLGVVKTPTAASPTLPLHGRPDRSSNAANHSRKIATISLCATLASCALTSILGAQAPPTPPMSADPALVEKANQEWRDWRRGRITSDTGWLTLIGLHWLQPGDNALGSAEGSRLPLPAEKAPAKLGVLRLEGGKVTLLPEPGTALTANGQPVGGPLALATDADEEPTLLELGSLNFYVIVRGDRVGVRVRDRQAKLRTEFRGFDYFQFDPKARVEAKFTPNPPGTTVPVADVLGMTQPMPSPGKVTFALGGQEFTITALDDTGDGRLYLIVGDKTNGYETYGAGRFLYADAPKDGVTIVDFNRAYNPPCAFTPWSTCQLPPRENKLPVRIEAGEKKFAQAP